MPPSNFRTKTSKRELAQDAVREAERLESSDGEPLAVEGDALEAVNGVRHLAPSIPSEERERMRRLQRESYNRLHGIATSDALQQKVIGHYDSRVCALLDAIDSGDMDAIKAARAKFV